MAKCKNCKSLIDWIDEDGIFRGKFCTKKNDFPDTDMERSCDYYEVMSQADRIRSMTDEALAEVFGRMAEPLCDCRPCPVGDRCDFLGSGQDGCREIFEKWLQSPVED